MPRPRRANGCSPHDRVDGCPHNQQGFVGWAPGQLPQAVTPTRQPMRSKEPDQDGPQLGQGHKDDPLRPHSPQEGKIWVEGREHARGEPSPSSFPCVSSSASCYLTPCPGLSTLSPHRRSGPRGSLPTWATPVPLLAPFLVSMDLFFPHLSFGTQRMLSGIANCF